MSILNTSVSGMLADLNWLSSISQNVANSNTTGYKNVETDFLSLVDSDFRQRPRVWRRRDQPDVPQLASGQHRLHFDVDRPRHSGLRLLRRIQLEWRALPHAQRIVHAKTPPGNLVNSAGYYLMGENVQNGASPLAANSLTGLVKVNVNDAGQTATATTAASLTANLPSTATPVAAANLPSANTASSTYTEATSLVVYDNLGAAHTINLYYTNTGANTWKSTPMTPRMRRPAAAFPIQPVRLPPRP